MPGNTRTVQKREKERLPSATKLIQDGKELLSSHRKKLERTQQRMEQIRRKRNLDEATIQAIRKKPTRAAPIRELDEKDDSYPEALCDRISETQQGLLASFRERQERIQRQERQIEQQAQREKEHRSKAMANKAWSAVRRFYGAFSALESWCSVEPLEKLKGERLTELQIEIKNAFNCTDPDVQCAAVKIFVRWFNTLDIRAAEQEFPKFVNVEDLSSGSGDPEGITKELMENLDSFLSKRIELKRHQMHGDDEVKEEVTPTDVELEDVESEDESVRDEEGMSPEVEARLVARDRRQRKDGVGLCLLFQVQPHVFFKPVENRYYEFAGKDSRLYTAEQLFTGDRFAHIEFKLDNIEDVQQLSQWLKQTSSVGYTFYISKQQDGTIQVILKVSDAKRVEGETEGQYQQRLMRSMVDMVLAYLAASGSGKVYVSGLNHHMVIAGVLFAQYLKTHTNQFSHIRVSSRFSQSALQQLPECQAAKQLVDKVIAQNTPEEFQRICGQVKQSQQQNCRLLSAISAA